MSAKLVSNSDVESVASGNTNKKQPNRNKYWFFTFNNYTEEDIGIIRQKFNKICLDYIFQEELGKLNGTPQNTTFFTQQFLQSNPFVSGTGSDTYDYYSSRNPDFFKQYEVLRTWKLFVRADQTA